MPRDEERRVGAAGVLGLVALLDRDRVQVRHERIQQNGLRMNGQKGFQGLGAVLLTDGHGNAFGFQRTAAHSGHLRVRVGHYKFDFSIVTYPPYILSCAYPARKLRSVSVYIGNSTIFSHIYQ